MGSVTSVTIDELLEQLQRLAPTARLANFEPRKRHSLSEILGGETMLTSRGTVHIVERFYGNEYCHGNVSLMAARGVTSLELATIQAEDAFESFDLQTTVFLDTETTGLTGGTGTLAFLIGVGRFVSDGFRLTQLLVPDLDAEEAMLAELRDLLLTAGTIVTYNGKAFDLPLLETRYTLNRIRWPLPDPLHADLLFAARRFWRERLESVSLPNVERQILGYVREEDVPGYLIPQIYAWYLRTKNPAPLRGVLEHNAQDILALAALIGAMAEHLRCWDAHTNPADLFSLARHFQRCRREADAVELLFRLWRQATDMPRHQKAFGLLTVYLKRAKQYEMARELWRREHELYGPSGEACVELAKYYEHKAKDVTEALRWALAACQCCPAGGSDLLRRIERLERKLSRRNMH